MVSFDSLIFKRDFRMLRATSRYFLWQIWQFITALARTPKKCIHPYPQTEGKEIRGCSDRATARQASWTSLTRWCWGPGKECALKEELRSTGRMATIQNLWVNMLPDFPQLPDKWHWWWCPRWRWQRCGTLCKYWFVFRGTTRWSSSLDLEYTHVALILGHTTNTRLQRSNIHFALITDVRP